MPGGVQKTGQDLPADSAPDEALLRFSLVPGDTTWERERDMHFASFVRQRLADAAATGCTEEKRYADGVRALYEEWDAKRELVLEDDLFAARVSTLGWALRCIASSAWRKAPGWGNWFQPTAVGPETAPETPT